MTTSSNYDTNLTSIETKVNLSFNLGKKGPLEELAESLTPLHYETDFYSLITL